MPIINGWLVLGLRKERRKTRHLRIPFSDIPSEDTIGRYERGRGPDLFRIRVVASLGEDTCDGLAGAGDPDAGSPEQVVALAALD